MRRLFQEHIMHYVPTLVMAVVFMMLTAGTTAATAWMLGPVFEWLFTDKNAAFLWPLAAMIFIIFTVKAFSAFGQGVLLNRIACRIVAELQDRMFKRLMRSDIAEFHASSSGGLVSRFTNDVQALSAAVSTAIIGAGKDSLTVVALIGFMFFNDWRLSLIAFVAFPAAAFPMVQYGRKVRGLSKRMQVQIGQMTSTLTQVFQGIRQVKAYNAEQRESEQASDIVWKVARLKQKSARIALAITPIMELLVGLAVVAIVLYGGSQVISGARPNGTFIVQFIAALLLAYDPMKRLARLNTQLQVGMAAAQRVFDLIDSKPLIVDRPSAVVLTPVEGRIALSGVQFSYGPNIPALHGVDIEIPAGKTVALVGPSGAGKSTVLNLIPRFYDVQDGSVTIDGHDIRDVTMHSLREQMALVSQEIMLFDQTVRDNIAFGRPGATEDEIVAAAKAAAAHDFITQLPDGYGTMVGEQGVKLSGGQRQRLSIARAMLKNAPILLLDEATSALDTESERQVQDALKRLMVGRTTLLIAHRLSTVADADSIYVLESGRVVEKGTHGDLIARPSLYAKLWNMQTTAPSSEEVVAAAGE
jgi:subfamily B ATP-binding cassette protein MsbA